MTSMNDKLEVNQVTDHQTITTTEVIDSKINLNNQQISNSIELTVNDNDLVKSFKEPTIQEGLMAIVKSSWINPLVIFVPFGIASHFVWSPTVTFILNFIAIVPLAKLLGFATEDISLRTGEIIGGLLNASFGNAVELIISIMALVQNLVVVVQASMLGSILSNLLLVLGMCFFGGGIKFKEQTFNVTAAQTSASLLFIATASLLLPAAFYGSTHGSESQNTVNYDILVISRATSIILLVIYISYLWFQLKTHKHLFLEEAYIEERRPTNHIVDSQNQAEQQNDEDNDEEETPQLPFWMAIML
ncbi:unnamed protein product [Cunninghamella blakesleeana]